MPRASIFLIRTALLNLALGALIGGLLLADKGLHRWGWLWALRPGHVYIMLLGWTVQFACGVAIWILPRLDAEGGRGAMWPVWVLYGTLNSSVLLATLYAPCLGWFGAERIVWMLPLAALLAVTGIGAFLGHAWRRVRPFGVMTAKRNA